MHDEDDFRFMARALRLAELGLYTTHPNPRVGCVLVKNGEVVGEGFHYKAGQPHAERVALAKAGAGASGATAYVTLEPCCHHGRTPPCTDALITAGVKRVVAAMRDPNPLVAGQGFEKLEAAGIETRTGVLESQARDLNPGFIKRMATGRPYVRCKLASSLDGRTALASGVSFWITKEAAREDVHRLRARSSAVLTGIGTVLHDDPALNVRLPVSALPGVESEEDIPLPLRVILDSDGRLPANAKMLAMAGEKLVFTAANTEKPRLERVETIAVERTTTGLDLNRVVRELAARGVNELLVESGATLAGAFVAEGLVDELIVYMAPHLMGGDARGMMNLPLLTRMDQRIELKYIDVRFVGDDLRITCRPQSVE